MKRILLKQVNQKNKIKLPLVRRCRRKLWNFFWQIGLDGNIISL